MNAFEQATEDPEFRAAVLRHYTGALEVLDALWWLDAPGRTAPSGAEPPWAGVEEARTRMYAPRPTEEDTERYRGLLAQRERELGRIREAVEALLDSPERYRRFEWRSRTNASMRSIDAGTIRTSGAG